MKMEYFVCGGAKQDELSTVDLSGANNKDLIFVGDGGYTKTQNVKGVSEIGTGAFSNCEAVQKVILPVSVSEIGESAFEGCKDLRIVEYTEVSQEEGNSSQNSMYIRKNAFKDCNGLHTVIFPSLLSKMNEDKRFRRNMEGNKYRWGEVILIQAPRREDDKEGSIPDYGDDIKYFDSSTVSVMASTAMLPEEFNLQRLEIEFRKDNHATSLDEYIYFRDILSWSVIVRVKQDNPRMKNQKAAFLLANANELVAIRDRGNDSVDNAVSPGEFTDFVLSDSEHAEELNLRNLKKGLCSRFPAQFQDTEAFDFCFKKVRPYSKDNKSLRMQDDPFNIRRLLYKDANGDQVVFLIPPTAKEHIKEQLSRLGITDAFIYPEMDSVSNELCERFSGGLK